MIKGKQAKQNLSYVKVNQLSVNARSQPSTNSTILFQVYYDEIFEKLYELDGWFKLTKKDGIQFWVMSDFLEEVDND
jgi:SH3-like domain-containing protein